MADKRIKDLATTITSFRTGDYIAVDGTDTAKMSKDDLLRVTAENAVGKRQTSSFTFSVNNYNGSQINISSVVADEDTYFVIENKQPGVDKVTFFTSGWGNLGQKTIPSALNNFKYKIPAGTAILQFHRTTLGSVGTATLTMYQGLSYDTLNSVDEIAKNKTDISNLDSRISNVVVPNFAQVFDDANDYVAGDKVVYNDVLYMFVYDHSAGSWNDKDVLAVDVAELLGRSESFTLCEEIGISESGDPKPMIERFFTKDKDTLVWVVVPKTLWSMTNIPNTSGYVFIVGYKDGGSDVVVKQYTRSAITAGEKIAIPAGYDNYFVKVRGDKDVQIEYTVLQLISQGDQTLNIGPKFDKEKDYTAGEFVVNDERISIFTFDHSAGAFNSKECLQLPLSDFAGRAIDVEKCSEVGISENGNVGQMISRTFSKGKEDVIYVALPPTTWNCSNIPNTSGYVLQVGYNNGMTDIVVRKMNKDVLGNNAGAKIELPTGYDSFFVRVRGNKDVSITYNILRLAKLNASGDSSVHDARAYDVADIYSRSLSFTSSDFPSDMKSLSSSYIRAYPIVKNPADITWGQGMTIASDGMGLVASYAGTNLILGIFDINNPQYATYSKSVSMPYQVHGNCLWFGSEKYDDDDKYPLLYVGGVIEENEASTLEVLRITGDLKDKDNVSFTLVQTITFPLSVGVVSDAQKIDGKLVALCINTIYTFGTFPAVSDGDVTLTDADITDTYVPSGSFSEPVQAGCVVDDKWYMITGVGSWCILHLIDAVNKTNKETLLPNFGEWECITYYDKMFFANTTQRNYRGVAQQEIICSLEMMM